MLVKIITPSSTLLEQEASIVTLPGEEGVFGVMPRHALLMANLKAGVTTIKLGEKTLQYFVQGGIAEVNGEAVNIVTEFSLDLTNVTKAEIQNKLDTLNNLLQGQSEQQLSATKYKLQQYQAVLACFIPDPIFK